MRDKNIDLEANRLDAAEELDSNRMAFSFLMAVGAVVLSWVFLIAAVYALIQMAAWWLA